MFNVHSDKGTVNIVVPGDAWIDAAKVNDLAGFEFPAESVRFNDNGDGRRSRLTVSVTIDPNIMTQFALMMLEKTEPGKAFNANEWQLIADVLKNDSRTVHLAERITVE